MLNKTGISAKLVLVFAVYMFVIYILNYLFRLPVTFRMNFFLTGYGIVSGLFLISAVVFPSRFTAVLVRLTQIAWIVAVVVGSSAIMVTMVSFIFKAQLPIISSQWYGLAMMMSLIGGVIVKRLGQAFDEVEMEASKRSSQSSTSESQSTSASTSTSVA